MQTELQAAGGCEPPSAVGPGESGPVTRHRHVRCDRKRGVVEAGARTL